MAHKLSTPEVEISRVTEFVKLKDAISAVGRAPPAEDRLNQFFKDPGATEDALDQAYRELIRSDDLSVVNRGFVMVHGEVVAQLNPAAVTYRICRSAASIGVDRALEELVANLRVSSVRCHSTAIAGGPTPAETTDIGNGISLTPYRKAQQDPVWQARLAALAPDENFIEACAPSCLWSKDVSVRCEIRKTAPPNWNGYPGRLPHLRWGPYIGTFAPILQLTALQTRYLPPAYPILHFMQPRDAGSWLNFKYVSAFAVGIVGPPVLLDATSVEDLCELNAALAAMRQSHPQDADRFDQCLRRLHRVFFSGLLDDQFVEARIALETTFTNPGYQRYPKSRVDANVKRYLGKVKDPRGSVYDVLSIYDTLSKPVHGDAVDLKPDNLGSISGALSGAVRLTALGLRKTLKLGILPDWDALRAEHRDRKSGPPGTAEL
jgi:hypothetical protein